MIKVVLFGPGPQFKGGISNYNTSLAKTLDKLGFEVHIVSWTQQYPAIIPRDFIDRSSIQDFLEGTKIKVHYITNYNNPISWAKTVDLIKKIAPQKVIFQWAIALQGLPMGWMARKLKKSGIEIIFDVHLVVQKESSKLDHWCSKYGLDAPDTFVTHAYKTAHELQELFPDKNFHVTEKGERHDAQPTIIKLYHPIYDLYEAKADFDLVAAKTEMELKPFVFLFFGFIRKYKGLHNVIKAFDKVQKQREDVSLLIVGESFWKTLDQNKMSTKLKSKLFSLAKSLFLKDSDNEQDYNPLALVDELNLHDTVKVYNEFVPNEKVHYFLQTADCMVLYYLTATPSGVESLSYNFSLPILATKVGHFPETIIDGFNGYLAEADNLNSMAAQMLRMVEHPIDRKNVKKTADNMSWENYAKTIMQTF